MATAADDTSIKQLDDITECCICHKAFTDPRILPCIHTMCLKCLQELGEKSEKNPGDSLPCPICRKEFVIPEDGVSGLQKNFFMGSLMEVMAMLRLRGTVIPCVICKTDAEPQDTEGRSHYKCHDAMLEMSRGYVWQMLQGTCATESHQGPSGRED